MSRTVAAPSGSRHTVKGTNSVVVIGVRLGTMRAKQRPRRRLHARGAPFAKIFSKIGVVPRARTLHHPPDRGPIRRRLALPRDLPPEPQLLQALAAQERVVAAVEVDACPLGPRPERPGRRL